ncbi:MAG: Ku protein [Chloroflexi bacterium]|nr:Ku protein [Chloroflexota bacterium]
MWRGAIQFGLVTIPVRLYLATESKSLSFNMLHRDCLTRIQQKIYCPHDDEVISRADTVRGFEYAKDQYVVVTEEDLASVPLKTVRAIEIERFVPARPADDEPPRFVKQGYWLEPEAVGRKAFTLLRAVLEEQGLVAICKVVIKDREALAALEPQGNTFLLETLFWPDEIRSTAELDLPEEEPVVKPAERAMAEQLVAAMTGDFEPEQYRDEYREALMAVIEAKVEGRETATPAEAEPGGELIDLMAALEASVAAARAGRETDRRAAPDEEPAEEPAARVRARTRRPQADDEEGEAAQAAPRRRRKTA